MFYDEASILQADRDTVATQLDVPPTRKAGSQNSNELSFKQNKAADPLNQQPVCRALTSPWNNFIFPKPLNKVVTELS